MHVGIVGCGFVADYYMTTLQNHPSLSVAGVFDRDSARAETFARFHHLRAYTSLDELLDDPTIELVVNLTNPSSHYEVSRAALERGRHVYSEKPLAMSLGDAERLVELAERRNLVLAGAPCTVLGEAAQTVWKTIRDGRLGTIRLVYAELDDGPIHQMNYRDWRSISGAPWPYDDEFKVGCTLEHAGYYLTWLATFFGPARRVTTFSSCLVQDKGAAERYTTPDFSVGCLEFASGVVARLTCSLLAPHERGMQIIGDKGVLHVEDCWDFGTSVRFLPRTKMGIRAEKHPTLARLAGLGPRSVPLARRPTFKWKVPGANRIDFARGVAEAAEAATERRPCRLSARMALHVNELALAMQHPVELGTPRTIATSFEPPAPMPWST
jgi:predicted dehydrogenase